MSIVNRVYRFGCRAPVESRLAEQMLGQAWLYREDLRRAYNAHKKDVRDFVAGVVEATHVRAYEDAVAATEEVGHVFVFEHKRAWRGLQDRLNQSIRDARAARGHLLDAGTYWLIEAAMLAASKACKVRGCANRPCSNSTHSNVPIARQHFDGTGRIGAEIQSRSQFPATAFGHRRVQLVPDGRYHRLTILVGKLSEGRSITWPIKLHRPFPAGAVVKQVAVQRTRVGHRFRWEALVTIAFEEAASATRDPKAVGVVGVDVGWRREGDLGMRVATHDAADGRDVLYVDTLSAFLYSDSIRSIRDTDFDLAKGYAADANLPGASHARQWRDKSRLVRLAARTNDLGTVWWRERDKHLEDIECMSRNRAMRRRIDAFRRYADRLAKRYRIVALEDMPMSAWVGEGDTHAAERRRLAAALYLLQLTLAQRFGPARTDWVPPAYTTMTCARCGVVRDSSVGPAAVWICACGAEHHQDENAAEIIRSNCERWIGDRNQVRARTRKSKKGKGKSTRQDEQRDAATTERGPSREPLAEAAE